jgi:N-acetylglutamate synthase-like GNAT family acetyltransferase
MEIRTPINTDEWSQYYDLRYRVLRQPWNQPVGSERDALENQAKHFAAFEAANLIGVGRLDHVEARIYQIRFMAVEPGCQSKGIGARLMKAIEMDAWNSGAVEIILHAREQALGFYQKLGYALVEPSHLLFGEIQHFLMKKKKG